VTRITALRILDSLWVDHLENMEALRGSVRLRAYGQKDPLIEYKNEGHRAFHQLLELFEERFSEMILKVKLVAPSFIEKSKTQGTIVPGKKRVKVGRNDPCPCGAKKEDGRPIKYKNCHGS
jgi:preprotein translocase subunit SecA